MKKILTDFRIIVLFIIALPIAFLLSSCGEDPQSTIKNFTGIAFENVTCDYDGNEHEITISGNLPEGAVVEYQNNKATNSGEYNASVKITLEGYNTLTLNARLKINKLTYDISNASWNYTSAFTYDGTEKQVLVTGLPSGVTVASYTNNEQTNAGTYTASVTLNYDTVNHNAISVNDLTWAINKATYDMSNASWDYTNAFTYDGTEKQVEVTGLPDGVTVASYTNNAQTNAGTYTASVTLNYDTVNHNAVRINDLTWTINKATYDMSSAGWNYTSAFTYDGTEKQVLVTGLPSGVTVASYSNNTQTNAGTYTASVTLNYDTINHNAIRINNLTWTINKATYDMSNATWNYTTPFTYDGTQKQVLVTGLPSGVTVASYSNNTKTDAGTYTASVTLRYDTVNHNTVSIEDCVWRIIPDVSQLALNIVESLLKVPDPWEFLPESFALENKAYTGNTEIDFTTFVNVSSLPKVAMGKQMNVVYSTLIDTENALSYLKYIYGSMNIIVGFYQTFINSNPDNYASYEKQTENFTFKIVLDDSDYQMFVLYNSVAIELGYELATQKCYGRIQLTDSTVLKYEMEDDSLTIAINILDVALTKLHFERNDNVVAGYLYEYYGTESKNIKTSALIAIDNNYTSIISNKRETDDLNIEGYMEVYKNSTGNLVGAEVRETVKSIKYETSWFNIYDVSGISTIKVLDEVNGLNADTIYINGSANPIETKKVGGVSLKTASRRFDIEMKDVYVYTYDQDNDKYTKVKINLPMLFVQNDYISSFTSDFYSANADNGASSTTTISLASADKTYMLAKYDTLIDTYVEIKNAVTYQDIKNYIGNKNEYFN